MTDVDRSESQAEGLGCRTLLTAVGILVAFAVTAVTVGLIMVLGDPPSAPSVGLALYAAGAPVSGLFAAVAGDLPLTLYLDILVWVLAGAGVTRLAERTGGLFRPIAGVIAIALVYGVAVSSLVELA